MDNSKTRKYLQEILHSSGWSQELLANKLGVSFKTLNTWVNGHASPRVKALAGIEQFYYDIVGRGSVEVDFLNKVKKQALKQRITLKEILANRELLDKITLHLTYHTNTIEGSTMTLQDVEDVIFDNKILTNRTTTEQIEARNHKAALYFLLDTLQVQGQRFQWTEELLLAAHLRLLNGIITNAGYYRKHSVRVLGYRAVLANFLKIPFLINKLFQELNNPTKDIIGSLAKTHAAFEQIHPFSDGNGRLGRLVMFIQALKYSLMPPLIVKERKKAYYRYLEIAQMENKTNLLTLFIAEAILFTNDLLNNKTL
ncbi:MAG: Fic family protein [Candidatus Margulisbacteria bacterium]|jgi:Fic family protein/DNA-binding XRE family transcriptional regulator|nr:Fic family protein [Candidatus Margulisiibacteriota bacterium]